MSLELVNTLAAIGTFLVIAATAITAIAELRHVRSSNQIAALDELRDSSETPHFRNAQRFVVNGLAKALEDPAFRYQLLHRDARTDQVQASIDKMHVVGNFYETMGLFLKTNLIDRDILLEIWCSNAVRDWSLLAPAAAIWRRVMGGGVWENFEYLAVMSQEWLTAHPDGMYPRNVRRYALVDTWRDADAQYERTRAETRETSASKVLTESGLTRQAR
jgi:hypothetical protein